MRNSTLTSDQKQNSMVENRTPGSSMKMKKEPNLRGTRKTISVLASYPQKPPKKKKMTISGTEQDKDDSQYTLSSPTSVQMQNTFIIKNADSSFDNYYSGMKQRLKTKMMSDHNVHDIMRKDKLQRQGLTRRRPAARDGHSSVLLNNKLYVFGGDRHHMPFNDLFVLDLNSELECLTKKANM